MGESPIITDAKADLTCWLGSITKSYGKTYNVDNRHYTKQFSALHWTEHTIILGFTMFHGLSVYSHQTMTLDQQKYRTVLFLM